MNTHRLRSERQVCEDKKLNTLACETSQFPCFTWRFLQALDDRCSAEFITKLSLLQYFHLPVCFCLRHTQELPLRWFHHRLV